jgi:hypothetical protein
MSPGPRTGAANFSLTAPMGAVRESTNQPTLAFQQKCEKLWTLPVPMSMVLFRALLIVSIVRLLVFLFSRPAVRYSPRPNFGCAV